MFIRSQAPLDTQAVEPLKFLCMDVAVPNPQWNQQPAFGDSKVAGDDLSECAGVWTSRLIFLKGDMACENNM